MFRCRGRDSHGPRLFVRLASSLALSRLPAGLLNRLAAATDLQQLLPPATADLGALADSLGVLWVVLFHLQRGVAQERRSAIPRAQAVVVSDGAACCRSFGPSVEHFSPDHAGAASGPRSPLSRSNCFATRSHARATICSSGIVERDHARAACRPARRADEVPPKMWLEPGTGPRAARSAAIFLSPLCRASLRSLMPLPPASHDCSSASRTCCSHASTLCLDRARSTAGANDHKRP